MAYSVHLLADRPELVAAVGAVGLGEYDTDERRDVSPWLLGMIVRPADRRSGVGRALLAALEVHARAAGYRTLWVATGTERAVAFYQACGWRASGRQLLASGEVATVLTRLLTTA
jgi:GNAT superfamily N-acetyltransferase